MIIGGTYSYNNYKKSKVNENNREGKLNILKNTMNEFDLSKDNRKISEEYTIIINEMKQYFIEDYNTVFKSNKLKDINKVLDIDKIKSKKTELNKLIELINREKSVFYSEVIINSLILEVDKVIEGYEKRIKKISGENLSKNLKGNRQQKINGISNSSGNNNFVDSQDEVDRTVVKLKNLRSNARTSNQVTGYRAVTHTEGGTKVYKNVDGTFTGIDADGNKFNADPGKEWWVFG